jgi:hypothetical protein
VYRLLLIGISLLAIPVILVGIATVVNALVGGYMVGVAGVAPGDPMYLDELARPLRTSILYFVIGVGIIALGLGARAFARARRRSVS